MIFAKLDVDITDHPKAIKAGLAAFGLWAWGVAYCRKHELDGEIPTEAVLLAMGGKGAKEAAAKLVEVGLWEVTSDGWRLVNYAKKNETKSQIAVRKEADRIRKQRVRSDSSRTLVADNDVVRLESEGIPKSKTPGSPVGIPLKGFPGSGSGSGSVLNPEGELEGAGPADEPSGIIPKLTANIRYREAYVAGIERGKGGGFAWPDGFDDDGALHRSILSHAKTHDKSAIKGARLLGWIEAAAFDFASDVTTKNTSRFFNSYGPKGFLKWLNDNEKTEEARRVG